MIDFYDVWLLLFVLIESLFMMFSILRFSSMIGMMRVLGLVFLCVIMWIIVMSDMSGNMKKN